MASWLKFLPVHWHDSPKMSKVLHIMQTMRKLPKGIWRLFQLTLSSRVFGRPSELAPHISSNLSKVRNTSWFSILKSQQKQTNWFRSQCMDFHTCPFLLTLCEEARVKRNTTELCLARQEYKTRNRAATLVAWEADFPMYTHPLAVLLQASHSRV